MGDFMRQALYLVVFLVFSTITLNAQFWNATDGPTLGTISLETNSKNHVFAGTDASSIHRSVDWGRTWTRLGTGLPNDGFDRPIRDISITATDEIYLIHQGNGIFKSVDNGDTWQSVNTGLSNPSGIVTVHAKAMPNGQTQVFIGSDGTAAKSFISDNSGATWTEVPLPSVQKTALYETFISPNSDKLIVSIGYNKGIFRSKNRGVTWRRIDSDSNGQGIPGGSESDDNYKSIRANKLGHIFVGRNALEASTVAKNAVIMRSTNDGETYEYLTNGWEELTPEIRTNNKVNGIAFGLGSDVYATTQKEGTYFSSNNGDNWSRLTDGLPDNGATAAIAATPNNHIFSAPLGFYNVFVHLDPANSVDNLPEIIKPTVTASPNPASDVVTIAFDLQQGGAVRAEVFSMQGNSVVEDFVREFVAGPQVINFTTSALPPGVYVWRLTTGGTVRSGRVIVAR